MDFIVYTQRRSINRQKWHLLLNCTYNTIILHWKYMRKMKPFHKIFYWQYNSIFIKKNSPIVVPPFKTRVSIKTCFSPILMLELYHTGILKMCLALHNLIWDIWEYYMCVFFLQFLQIIVFSICIEAITSACAKNNFFVVRDVIFWT